MTDRTAWDPGQYLRYADDRARPFGDLLARVRVAAAGSVVDLGCGPGHLTALLAARWPTASIVGVDSSAEMIAAAERESSTAGGRPALRFVRADLRDWQPDGPVDVVACNAVLHWVPEPLRQLARIAGWLAPGGALAVQVPGNGEAPSHTELAALCRAPRWRDRLAGVALPDTGSDSTAYLDALAAAGLRPDVWETTYLHVLTGDDPVLEWLKGSALRPVLARLEPAERDQFCADLAGRLRAAYPPRSYGTVLPFRRVFAVGHRPAG